MRTKTSPRTNPSRAKPQPLAGRSTLPVCVVFLGILLSGCGLPDARSSETGPTIPITPDYAISIMQQKPDFAGSAPAYDTLEEALPNRIYESRATAMSGTASDVVVRGEVDAARQGGAFAASFENGEEHVHELPFDSPDAQWKTGHIEVRVDSVIAGDYTENRIVLGLSFSPNIDFDRFAASVQSLGDVVVLLTSEAPVYDYAEDVYGVVGPGEFEYFATVAEDGSLSLPFIADESEAQQALGATPSVEALQEAAAQPPRTIFVG